MQNTQLETKIINKDTGEDSIYTFDKIANFLYTHLDDYGDDKKHILNCISYAMATKPGQDGYIFIGLIDSEIAGAIIFNSTNMGGYIPENILVYIAMHRKHRGKGIGKLLITEGLKHCKGDVALHVEKDNPAKFLYEKVGFTNPYLEMRLKR